MERILVTGGSGMVGKCLQKICKENKLENYIFVSTKDADLTDYNQTKLLIEKFSPTVVIHLASVVGGLFFNLNNNSKMLDTNTRINLNTIKCCSEFNVQKVIVVLSTCAFPYTIDTFPMTEEDLHKGPVHPTNEGYGESKRIAEILARMYSISSKSKFICLFPCNLYGENDNFSEHGHVLSGLISKCHNAKIHNTDLKVFGSGKPLRQFLFAEDFANALINIVDNFESVNEEKLIICNDNDEISINNLAKMVANTINFKGNIVNDISKSDGIYRKTVSNSKFKKIFKDFKFTSLEKGISKTYEWFKKNTLLKITGDISPYGLSGGIGNQLFLIATTMAISYEYNMTPFFRYHGIDKYTYENDHTKTILKNLTFLNEEDLNEYTIVNDNNSVFRIPDNPQTNTVINGYFQTSKNFDKYKDKIIDLLYFSEQDNSFVNEYINQLKIYNKKLLGVHFRRKDYHNLGWVLPLTYYEKTMKEFADYTIILFSDDPDYCIENYPQYTLCNTGTDYIDMLILSKMDSCIMSNSTFCWWAIYIGNIKDVIAPFPWFPNHEYNKNIYEENWNRVDYL